MSLKLYEQEKVIKKNMEIIREQLKDNDELHHELDDLAAKVAGIVEQNTEL